VAASPTTADLRRRLKQAEKDRAEIIQLRDYTRSNLTAGIRELRKLQKQAPADKKQLAKNALDDALAIQKIANARTKTMLQDVDRSIRQLRSEIEKRKKG
jgi:hypothetical protein